MKYIIEIKPEYEDTTKGIIVLGARDSNLYVDALDIENLEELNSDYINEHYGELQDTAYQRGLEDAWECAKKLFSIMSETEIKKVFPTEWENGFYGLMQMKPQYAIEKLKSHEDDKIRRGDIVNVKGSCNDGLLGVVTKVLEDDCHIMWGDGSCGTRSKYLVVKTGKHIDIDKVFEEMAT